MVGRLQLQEPNKHGGFIFTKQQDNGIYFTYKDPCMTVPIIMVSDGVASDKVHFFYQYDCDNMAVYFKINDGYVQAYQWMDGCFKKVCVLKIGAPNGEWIHANKGRCKNVY